MALRFRPLSLLLVVTSTFACASLACSGSGTGTPVGDVFGAPDAGKNNAQPSAPDGGGGSSGQFGEPEPGEPAADAGPTTPSEFPAPTGDADAAMHVPQTNGQITSRDLVLSQTKKTEGLPMSSSAYYATCPLYAPSIPPASVPYVWVEVRNPGAKRALTSIWTSSIPGTTAADTSDAIAVFSGANVPTEKTGCVGRAVRYCAEEPCTEGPGLSALSGNAVEIAAGASVLVFVQGLPTQTGGFRLSVKTELLQ